MRICPGVFTTLLACLSLAGCTSSTGIEELVPRPSMETTSAIAPRPDAPVRASAGDTDAGFPDITALAGSEPSGGDDVARPPLATLAAMPSPRPVGASKPRARGVVHKRRFRDAHPINFGKRSPKHLAVHGVDVSRWQGDIDWKKLRGQGANFVFIKATDGGDHIDPMFGENWRDAARAGLKRGAYHFFYWCRTASSQADWFISHVPKVAGALPPVIDVEWNHQSSCKRRPSRATVLEKMQVFMDRLERHYGQRPIIYTSPDFYADNLEGAFPNHPFWLRSVAVHPSKVYADRKWVFWQYSGSGLSHGVTGRIDLNVFNGSESDWWRWLGRATGGDGMVAEAD